jgi:prefoldin subunit 5
MAENPLGIPKAEFIEDIAAAAPTTEKLQQIYGEKQEILAKYRILEQHLNEKSQNYKASRPDIAENLKAVQRLASSAYQQQLVTHFQISDSLYGTAKLKNDQTVSLWLGANVMVEYTYSEAEALLQTKLDGIDSQLAEIESHLIFLRDQIITTEVTVARLTNHLVQMRRAAPK